jgi:hypothetical protein
MLPVDPSILFYISCLSVPSSFCSRLGRALFKVFSARLHLYKGLWKSPLQLFACFFRLSLVVLSL